MARKGQIPMAEYMAKKCAPTRAIFADKENIQKMYWEEMLSHREIALAYGCSRNLVSKFSRELGIYGIATSSRIVGSKNRNWKGGKLIDGNGYLVHRVPVKDHKYGRVFDHRLVVERSIGRPLRQGEIVHHIDGNKLNNRNDNLLVCDNKYHEWLHKKMSWLYQRDHFGKRLED